MSSTDRVSVSDGFGRTLRRREASHRGVRRGARDLGVSADKGDAFVGSSNTSVVSVVDVGIAGASCTVGVGKEVDASTR